MYLTPTEKHWVVDIETDGLDPTCVWVVVCVNAVTRKEIVCETYDDIRKFFDDTKDCYYVGHNFIAFDAPVLNRLVGTRINSRRLVDTFLLSSHYSPNLAGGHSLDAWGTRVGVAKPSHEEWDKYSDAMRERCRADVEITLRTFERLTKRMRQVGFTELGCEIEHKAWRVIQKQRKNGFWFNFEQAHQLLAELEAKRAELTEKIHERFPPTLELISTYKKASKASGEPTEVFKRHEREYERLDVKPDGTYDAYGYVAFDIGSSLQRTKRLQALGWVPREFTPPSPSFPEGQPQTTRKGDLVPSLREFAEESGIEEVRLIAEWVAVTGRINIINDWMNNYDSSDGCIHGTLWLASTLRYRHDKPNTANIPRVRLDKQDKPLKGAAGFWTYEARDLWQTRDPKTRRLVGVDAKGMQLRNLAHYLNNPSFTEAILSEDPHTFNAKRMGLPSRDVAKTITYATLMGAGDGRIASEAKLTMKEAKAAKNTFFVQVPELPELIKKLQRDLKQTGRIVLCDGSPVMVPSPHMVIPYLLQGDESRIMKQAAILVDEAVMREKLDVLKVGDIHDEWQSDVLAEHIERFIEICREAFARAREIFQYCIPLECDAKIGLTWAETH